MNDFKYILINTSFRISNVVRFVPLFILTTLLFGQDAKTLYLFEFEDESEYAGQLISETPDIVIIKRMDGSVINIPAYKIIKRTRINISQSDSTLAYWDEKSDEIIFSNLHDTRYFFSPSAFALDEGEGYSMNAYSLYWAFQYGINHNLSFGAGASVFGLTSLSAKYTVPSYNEDFKLAVGWFWVGFPLAYDDKSIINIPFTVATWGDKEKNISSGFGFNLEANKNPLVLNIGGTNRMSRSTALVFELWKFNYKSEIDTKTLIYGGPGVRLLRKKTKKRLFGIFKQNNYAGSNVIDFQIFFSYNDGKTIGPLPMIGASTRF